MFRTAACLLLLLIPSMYGNTQAVAINSDGTDPHASALLDLKSNSKGILIPRMTTAERKSITDPAKGLLVFDTNRSDFLFWDGNEWKAIGGKQDGLTQNFTPPEMSNGSRLGREAVIKGDFAAVSARMPDNKKVVLIYRKTFGGNWALDTTLAPPSTSSVTEEFGHALDMDGDYLVVGDYRKKGADGVERGAVYVYRKGGTQWNLESVIERTSGAGLDAFGWDVAISTSAPQGPTIAVGIPRSDGSYGLNMSGMVQLYKKGATAWEVATTISKAGFVQSGQVGYSVDIEGNLLAIGSPFREGSQGALYLYRYNNTVNYWQEEFHTFNFPDKALGGYDVSISGGRVACGVPSSSVEQGEVRIFHISGPNWNSEVIRSPYAIYEGGYARFGAAVSLDGENLMVGAPGIVQIPGGEIGGNQPGKAVLFRLRYGASGIDHSLRTVWRSPFFRSSDGFGFRVGVSGSGFLFTHPGFSSVSYNAIGNVQFGTVE